MPPVKPAEPEQPLIELPSLEPGPNEKGAWRKVPLKRVPRRGFRLNTGTTAELGAVHAPVKLADVYAGKILFIPIVYLPTIIPCSLPNAPCAGASWNC